MIIPYKELNRDTLIAVIEAFALREGTEYGKNDIPLDEKKEQILMQLEDGKVNIVFDDKSKSCNILPSSK